MARVEHTTTARLPVETIWDFVRDLDHWAPFVAGYQSHEKESEDDSLWVLKGDLGSMSRTLKFRVHVTEWAGPERVRFELRGLNEPMEGSGLFTMAPYEDADGGPAPAASPRSAWSRLTDALARLVLRLFRGRAERGADADAGPGAGMARLTFELELRPGGPMGPMVDAMIRPAMAAAAEDLANRIIGHLERTHG